MFSCLNELGAVLSIKLISEMKLFHHGSCEPDSNQNKVGHQDGWNHGSQKLQAPDSDVGR